MIDVATQSHRSENGAHRVNLYLTSPLFESLQDIAGDNGYRSVTEVVQHALRVIVLAHKYETEADKGLYWRDGEQYSKVWLV